MTEAGASLVARFSSTTNVALFVIVTFSFFTVISGQCGPYCERTAGLVCCSGQCVRDFSCLGRSCRRDSDCFRTESCCGKKCAYGSSCLYQQCSTDADCSVNQACCSSLCRNENSCLGRWCSVDSDCSFNQSCCADKCVQGKSCLGQKCILDEDCADGQWCCQDTCKKGHCPLRQKCILDEDCADGQWCCQDTCKKGHCPLSPVYLPYILVSTVGIVVFLIVCAILVYRCRKRRRRLMAGEIISTNNITTNTNMSTVSVTQCNPLYQPEGPPSDQPTAQPPPYTSTPTEGADGMYAPQTDLLSASGQRKTEGAV